MFSSIEESSRIEVIKKCYWPILNLAKDGFKLSIEATALTINIINDLDASWILQLKELLHNNKIEFIGSGYSQIIAPVVPHEINEKNLKYGLQEYKRLLGFEPSIFLVNEMVFSEDLIELYVANGVKTIIIEWNNFSKYTDNIYQELNKRPIILQDRFENEINIVWADTIAFQKFQRFAHGEYSEDYFFNYLNSMIEKYSAYPLYMSDGEVFSFRPGRYKTENGLQADEWEKIKKVYQYISKIFELTFLRDILSEDIQVVRFKSQHPIQVKKQDKYNIFRWTLNGKNNLLNNATCFSIFGNFINRAESIPIEDWKELIYLWSSDFRTHITQTRYDEFKSRLFNLALKYTPLETAQTKSLAEELEFQDKDDLIYLSSRNSSLILNKKKGLTIESYKGSNSSKPLIGHLEHGHFDDISYGSDFFSGYSVCYDKLNRQYTKLGLCEYDILKHPDHIEVNSIGISSEFVIEDCFLFYAHKLILKKKISFNPLEVKIIHPFFFTFLIDEKDSDLMSFITKSGGSKYYSYDINSYRNFDRKTHYISVSAQHGFLPTDGILKFFVADQNIEFKNNNSLAPIVASFEFNSSVGVFEKKPLLWLIFSALENDDTSKTNFDGKSCLEFELTIS